jgi:hypothetical protein
VYHKINRLSFFTTFVQSYSERKKAPEPEPSPSEVKSPALQKAEPEPALKGEADSVHLAEGETAPESPARGEAAPEPSAKRSRRAANPSDKALNDMEEDEGVSAKCANKKLPTRASREVQVDSESAKATSADTKKRARDTSPEVEPPRRSTRTLKSSKPQLDLATTSPARVRQQPRRTSRGRPKYSFIEEASERVVSGNAASHDNYRVLKRVVPLENEDILREEVRKECKDLLVCEEPLVEDKQQHIGYAQVKFNRNFEDMFLDFLVFAKAYGHCYVPKFCVDNPALGRWVCKVRLWNNKNHDHLTPSRFKRLDKAGFVWEPKKDPTFWKVQSNHNERAEEIWDFHYDELIKYKQAVSMGRSYLYSAIASPITHALAISVQHGNCLVPKEYGVSLYLLA